MIYSGKFLRVAVLGAALSGLMVVGAAASSIGAGTVNADALRLRDSANTDATVLATAAKGESVLLLEDAGNGWYKVDYKTVEGYMSAEFLTAQTAADVKIGYGMVNTDGATLNMRSAPNATADKVAVLPNSTVVDIIGVNGNWLKVTYSDKTGYVSSDYMITVKDSGGSRGDGTVAASNSSLAQQIIDYAKTFMGVPYRYGASGPNSFDCSGYTSYIYAHFGYTLNRSASDQLSNGTKVASMSELQPGDLVFFNDGSTRKAASHVGMYIGNGQFIHASTNGVGQIQVNELFTGYYSRVYIGGRHII